MKKITVIMLCTMLLFCTVGCEQSTSEKQNHQYIVGESKVVLYYPHGKEVVYDDELYQLKQPDSVTTSVEEIMGAVSGKLNDKIKYHTYMLDEENNLSLEFMVENGRLTDDELLLSEAAVTKTLFQIGAIGSITLNTQFNEDETVRSKIYTRNSFYFHGYDAQMGLNTTNVRIYVATEDDKLTAKDVSCNPDACKSIIDCIIEYLALNGTIPKDTEVKSQYINNGVCYLELTKEFTNPANNHKSEIIAYSIVNSVTSIDGIDKVVITVESSNTGLYRGTFDISVPLEFNEELVQKK